jgi:hypothetical protein
LGVDLTPTTQKSTKKNNVKYSNLGFRKHSGPNIFDKTAKADRRNPSPSKQNDRKRRSTSTDYPTKNNSNMKNTHVRNFKQSY